jgi:hypothetical protein
MTYNPAERETVVRRINLPAFVVARMLDLPIATRLGPRRFRVIVDVAEWSDDACELRVRPVSRHVGRWSQRRQRRYFALAHAAADAFVHLVGLPRLATRKEPSDGLHHTGHPHRRSA